MISTVGRKELSTIQTPGRQMIEHRQKQAERYGRRR